jgi:methylated-DNA-protein-cysteine methyltransferase-like protein
MNTFDEVYKQVKRIPYGKVTTYGDIAKKLGISNPRVVGYALHVNKDPDNIPCHRVVNKTGEPAKGYAFGGLGVQEKLLKSEGVAFSNGKVLLSKHLYRL